jgi:hypothetical protein
MRDFNRRNQSVLRVATTFALLAGAGQSEALPLLARSAQAAGVPLAVIPCAPATPSPRVLLVQRVLVQTRSGGRSQPATIPAFAGQWGPIAGSVASSSQPVQSVAARLFYAQTGVALTAASGGRVFSDENDFELAQTVVVPETEAELARLAEEVNQAIAAGAPQEGVLSSVESVPLGDAVARLGPVAPPEGGWPSYIVRAAFGGQMPGALDVEFPILVQQIAFRTQMVSDAFQTALLLAARSCGEAPGPP